MEAWLVRLLFTDDPHVPTGETEWRRAIEQMHAELGLAGRGSTTSAWPCFRRSAAPSSPPRGSREVESALGA